MSEFVCESPARKLRRELGLPERVSRKRARVDDWYGLSTGDRVYCVDDPAHVGRVNGWEGWIVFVQWDNGWREEVARDLLVKAGSE